MNPKFADDRISAYLDGKLEAAEAAEIRQELSRNHELRCLVDELRQARGELQALPRMRTAGGFADRVMARIADVQHDQLAAGRDSKADITPRRDNHSPVTVKQRQLGVLQAFAMGVTAASVLALAGWAFFLRGSDGTGPAVVQSPIDVPSAHANNDNQPAELGDRKLTLAQFAETLQSKNSQGQVYLMRVTVSNNVLLQGKLDEQLVRHGLTVHGSLNNRPAMRSATAAIEKIEPITLATTRLPVDEVYVLDGTAEQLAAALPVWTEQPSDVAHASDEVLAVDPREKIGSPMPELDHVAVRIGRKQLYREMGIDVAQGESNATPEGTSEVLVVLRVK